MASALTDPFIDVHHGRGRFFTSDLVRQHPPPVMGSRRKHADYLQHRVVELETELRLVREQLYGSHSGMPYLAGCIEGHKAQVQEIEHAKLRYELREVQAHNAQLQQLIDSFGHRALIGKKSNSDVNHRGPRSDVKSATSRPGRGLQRQTTGAQVGLGSNVTGCGRLTSSRSRDITPTPVPRSHHHVASDWGTCHTRQSANQEAMELPHACNVWHSPSMTHLASEGDHQIEHNDDDHWCDDHRSFGTSEWDEHKKTSIDAWVHSQPRFSENRLDPLREAPDFDNWKGLGRMKGSDLQRIRHPSLDCEDRTTVDVCSDIYGLDEGDFDIKTDRVMIAQPERGQRSSLMSPDSGTTELQDVFKLFSESTKDTFTLDDTKSTRGWTILSPSRSVQNDVMWSPMVPLSPVEEPEEELTFGARFTWSEQDYLTNAATFIEDLRDCDENYQQHWVRLADQHPRWKGRHPADEWRIFYEKVVRPKCKVQDVATKESALSSVVRTETLKATVDKLTERFSGPDLSLEGIGYFCLHDGVEAPSGCQRNPSDVERITSEGDADIRVSIQHSQGTVDLPHLPSSEPWTNDHLTRAGEHNRSRSVTRDAPGPSTATTVPATTRTGSNIAPGRISPDTTNVQRDISRGSRHGTSRQEGYGTSSVPWNYCGLFYCIGSNDRNLFRTVIVSHVPNDVDLTDVVNRFHDVKTVSVRFARTAGMRTLPPTDSDSVIVECLWASDARSFVDRCLKEPVEFVASKTPSIKARAHLVQSPSRPLRADLVEEMISGTLSRTIYTVAPAHDQTPDQLVAHIVKCIQRRDNVTPCVKPISICIGQDGVVFFEFAHVCLAAVAHQALREEMENLGGMQMGFCVEQDRRTGKLMTNIR